jgi:hypothetical protein
VTTSTAVVRTLAPGREAAVDRFLVRLGALGPEGWGRLDAVAERLGAGDPIARWQSAERHAAFAGSVPTLKTVVHAVVFAHSLVGGLFGRGPRPRPVRAASVGRRSVGVAGDSNTERLNQQLRSLVDLYDAQPGGWDGTFDLVLTTLLALHLRDRIPPDAFRRLYAPAERVIPLASVDP